MFNGLKCFKSAPPYNIKYEAALSISIPSRHMKTAEVKNRVEFDQVSYI